MYYSSLKEISDLIRQPQISPVRIVDICLKRIEALNPKINAFITVLIDQARQQARIAEAEIKAGRWRGPLHGIPVGIKDFYDTAGVKTTAAFEHYRDRVPTRDAMAVTRLREAGAIIIGKMNMHKLGMGQPGWIASLDLSVTHGMMTIFLAALLLGRPSPLPVDCVTPRSIPTRLVPVVCPPRVVVSLVSKVRTA